MENNLLFNFSFDLAFLALVIFIVGLIAKKIKYHKHHFSHWLSIIIILLTGSLMFLSYGGLKLYQDTSKLPSQNKIEINLLRQQIINLKRKKRHPVHKKVRNKTKAKVKHLSKRINSSKKNAQLKKLATKHPVKINNLAARVKAVNKKKRTVMVCGIHSKQNYQIVKFKDHSIKPQQLVTVKGTTIKVNHGTVIIKNANVIRKK